MWPWVDRGHQQLGCLLLETSRESFGLLEPIRKVLESDESDMIPCWALDSVIRDTIIIRIDTANLARVKRV
jgi:hypothetical protein